MKYFKRKQNKKKLHKLQLQKLMIMFLILEASRLKKSLQREKKRYKNCEE